MKQYLKYLKFVCLVGLLLLFSCGKRSTGPEYNRAPLAPSNPLPAIYTDSVSVYTSLVWSCSDPDGDSLCYDIYLGLTETPELVASDYSDTVYIPGKLVNDTIYYWMITAKDENDNSTQSDIWKFYTGVNHLPMKPLLVYPADSAESLDLEVTVSWDCVDPDGDVLLYDVLFSGSEKYLLVASRNQSARNFSPPNLLYNHRYYWRIYAKDGSGDSTLSARSVFTTKSYKTSWENTFGGGGNEQGEAIDQALDGGFILVGTKDSYSGGENDIYLIKTSAGGEEQWTRTYGGAGNDYGTAVKTLPDGGYAVLGYTDSYGAGSYDVYLIKIDAMGSVLWSRTYGGNEDDWGKDMELSVDGGFVIAGVTRSFGINRWGFSHFLFKTDADGDSVWYRVHEDEDSDTRYSSLTRTYDGGFAACGHYESSTIHGCLIDFGFLSKFDSEGNHEWWKGYGNCGNNFYTVEMTLDGGFVIAGSPGYIVKTDAMGNMQWEKYLGDEHIYGAVEIERVGYVLTMDEYIYAGVSNVRMRIIDYNGELSSSKSFKINPCNKGQYLKYCPDGCIAIAGYTYTSPPVSRKAFAIKLELEP